MELKASDASPGRAPGGARLRVGVSLRDALAAVLEAPDGVVEVEDDGGNLVGVVRPASIHAAARRSLDGA